MKYGCYNKDCTAGLFEIIGSYSKDNTLELPELQATLLKIWGLGTGQVGKLYYPILVLGKGICGNFDSGRKLSSPKLCPSHALCRIWRTPELDLNVIIFTQISFLRSQDVIFYLEGVIFVYKLSCTAWVHLLYKSKTDFYSTLSERKKYIGEVKFIYPSVLKT